MISKRQILDVCNKMYQSNVGRYLIQSKSGAKFNATAMANDLIFQLAIDESEYETALRGVHEWWSESTYNPDNKKFKA